MTECFCGHDLDDHENDGNCSMDGCDCFEFDPIEEDEDGLIDVENDDVPMCGDVDE